MPVPDPPAPTDLDAAMATMRRGAAFVGLGLAHAGAGPVPGRWAERCRARLAGNGLRELDRFLNLLIDAAAEAAGAVARPGQSNTAAKYRGIAPAGRHDAADHRRLLALGRSRACLYYCEGVVRRPDRRGGATMTAGWPDAGGRLRVVRLGDGLAPPAADFADVARFYARLADRIAARCG